MQELTEREKVAFKTIIDDTMYTMGAKIPSHIHDDNCSWHNHTTIMESGYTEPQAKGFLSSLDSKGYIHNYDPDSEWGWALTGEGIDKAQEYFGEEND